MSEIEKLMKSHLKNKALHASENNVWAGNNKYNTIRDLAIDLRGELGEEFIADLLRRCGYEVEPNTITDRTKRHWDIKVNGECKMEIKTASRGAKKPTFQHESIERDRDYDVLVLLDIAPNSIYLTFAPKDTLPFNAANKNWSKRSKKMHRRAHGILYKWTLNETDLKDREIKSLDDVKRLLPPDLLTN